MSSWLCSEMLHTFQCGEDSSTGCHPVTLPPLLCQYDPPLIPPRGEVNAADAFDIGSFDEEDTKGIKVCVLSLPVTGGGGTCLWASTRKRDPIRSVQMELEGWGSAGRPPMSPSPTTLVLAPLDSCWTVTKSYTKTSHW